MVLELIVPRKPWVVLLSIIRSSADDLGGDLIVMKTMASKPISSPDCDVVVIGAGPYGLSAAAHLKANGLSVRVFGEPMEFWANKMPSGMLLRSPRIASNISAPQFSFTLGAFEAETGRESHEYTALDTFVAYGCWFHSQLGSITDRRTIARVSHRDSIFRLDLDGGDVITSRRLVVATGIGPFLKLPEAFQALRSNRVSHCYEGKPISEFSGRSVAVIGAGQSSLESAALLHEAGATVEVIARQKDLHWVGMHGWLHHLGPLSTLLYSSHDIGPAGISRLVASPDLMSHIPLSLRDKIRTRAVRPAGAKWLPPRLANIVITKGVSVMTVDDAGSSGIRLVLTDGSNRLVDHVLLGTGYRVDVSRYSFLSPELLKDITLIDGYPRLVRGLAASVPGLYFIGAPAARQFGPLLYFVAGTDFASRSLVSHVVAASRRR